MTAIKYNAETDELLCVFSGRMDAGTSKVVTEEFNKAWQAALQARGEKSAGMKIIFDLGGVDFIASAFLRLCMLAAKKPGGNNLQVINTSPEVKKLFMVAGMDFCCR